MNELELCPDCPAKHLIPLATKILKEKQLIKTNEKPSALKICMTLRTILWENGEECPHYPRTENLILWQKAKP